jgi:hypothetical protein
VAASPTAAAAALVHGGVGDLGPRGELGLRDEIPDLKQKFQTLFCLGGRCGHGDLLGARFATSDHNSLPNIGS